ncbi:MAG: HEAT repeat domain-containing protein [Candidatus Scalindua sp.]|nr:HEAT repeat domain-containing protein [Candidatus Scalindua sp.]MCR4344393.1 HEAT repeat domain-containing protein [Candidatus Scalindua sp.]
MKIINKLPCIIPITLLIFTVHIKVALPVEIAHDIMVIARHGTLENTPENTIVAFEKAADIGVRGLKVDVRQTRDGKLVLMSDATIDRTTDGKGYVSLLTYEEIKLYDAGSWMSEKFAGERVPLLSDALQLAKERKLKLIINVKEHGIEQKTLSLIKEFDMINHVYFSGRLETLRDKDIDIKGAQLIFLSPDEATNDTMDLIHERHDHVGTRLFGTDDRDKMKEKMFTGVDFILTDYPSVAIDLLHFRTINKPEKREPRRKLESNIAGNTAQIDALIDAITHGDPDQSRIAALIFSTLPANLAVPPLVKRLDYKKPLTRFLPRMRIRIPFINKEIQNEGDLLHAAIVQKNIVWTLGLIKNKSAVEPLIKRLETADSDLKREIILALKMIGNKQAVPVLKEILLNDENPYVRFDAARALGSIENTDSVFTLLRAMKTDESFLVKGSCAEALGKLGDNRAANALKTLLNTDAGENASWARDRAALALSKIGLGGIEALVSSLGASGTSTRRRASWVLMDIGDPAVPYLLSALREISSLARKRAAMVLGWIGNKEAVLPITWALADEDPEVKKMAIWALGKIGEDKAATALEHAIDDHNQKEEIINNEIVVLNRQQHVLVGQIAALKDEITLQGFPVLKDQIAALEDEIMEQEISKDETQSRTDENRKSHYNKALFKGIKEQWDFRPVVLAATMLEVAVTENSKIQLAIKELKKVLQENNDIKEYAREAIQRLNYN